MDTPNLDQVSSQALIRLAGERGLAPAVTPAGEELVRKPKRGWKRWLPMLFFALSLFALGSMALGITTLADDGWSWSDAVPLALMAILVLGTIAQARTMLRTTRFRRFVERAPAPRKTDGPGAPAPNSSHWLDGVSAEYLAALRPAEARTMARTTAARHAGSRAFERVSLWIVLGLAVLAFAGMLFVLGYIVYTSGFSNASFWLTAPFTALAGFGVFQLFRSARQMSFRGRPLKLLSRTFRDSVRVWGSGSMAMKVAVTTTATASIAGAAVVPALAPQDTQFDIFAIDSASGAVYRIDLETHDSARTRAETPQLKAVSLGTTSMPVARDNGRKLPNGSLVVVLESPGERAQVVIGFPPGSNAPVPLGRIEPPLPGARFTGGAGVLHALQPDGALWRVDLSTGAPTRVATVGVPGPFTFERDTNTLLVVQGEQLVRLDARSGVERGRVPLTASGSAPVCAIADGPKDTVFLAFEGSSEVQVFKTNSKSLARIVPKGDLPASPCEMTLAFRK